MDVAIVMAEIIIRDGGYAEGSLTVHHLEEGFHLVSVSILVFFLYELAATILYKRVEFFTSWVHMLDLVVVVASLALELTFGDNAGFLVVLRMWRVFRVIHAIFEVQHKHELQSGPALHGLHKDLKKMLREQEQILEHELQQKRANDQKIARLKQRLSDRRNGSPSSEYTV